MRRKRHTTTKSARGEGPAYGATRSLGKQVAEVHGTDARVFVTREPDGLYYTWRQRYMADDPDPHWYLAFKSKPKAMEHMRTLAGG